MAADRMQYVSLSDMSSRADVNYGTGSPRAGSGFSLSTASSGSRSSLSAQPGGGRSSEQFDLQFVSQADRKFFCPACDKAMRYPIQFQECGHRCCSACLQTIVKSSGRCPVDQLRVDLSSAYPDKAFQLELETQIVKCVYQSKGCQWTGTITDLKIHMDTCEFVVINCPKNCGVSFGRCFLVGHLVNDCLKREILCDFCGESTTHADEVEHVRVCGKFTISCPNACGTKDFLREQLPAHLEVCPKIKLPCPFADAGCPHEALRKDLDDHMALCFDDHYTMVLQALIGLRAALTDREAELTDRMRYLTSRVNTLAKANIETPVWRIENWSQIYKKAMNGQTNAVTGPNVTTGTLGTGYRLSLSVYPFGDGIDQGQFMSVYINMCRTDADGLLKWPFDRRITVTLVDQCPHVESQRHVVQTIDASLENPRVVARPHADRGPVFGFRQFVRLELLNIADHYIREDAICFLVEID